MVYSYKQIWKIALPVVIGLTAQNLMIVIDTAFLSRVSEVALGAAAIGGIFYLALVTLGTGLATGVQIMIGRRNGQGSTEEIGAIFDNSFYIFIFLAVFLWLFLSFLAPLLLSHVISSEAILQESLRFIEFRKYGLFFGLSVMVFNALYTGTTRTKVLSLGTTIMAITNVVFDYILIFGHLGLPAMGIAGAALATNIAEFATFVFYISWIFVKSDHRRYRLFKFNFPALELVQRLIKLASPVMLQYFISIAGWFVLFLIIEQLGETQLAASNIIRSIYMFLMIPVWGLSISVNTMVSNLIGQGNQNQVISLIRKVLLIGLSCNLLIIILINLTPLYWISIYTSNPILIQTTLPLLKVISVALILFAFAMISISGLSGTGKTFLALKIEIISITLYLSSALIISRLLNGDVMMIWMAEIVYFAFIGIMAILALKYSKWRGIKI